VSGDPFGRGEDDNRTDAFGNPVTPGDPLATPREPEPESSPSGWLPPVPDRDDPPAEQAPPREVSPGWLPPSERETEAPAGSLAPGARWPPPATAGLSLASYGQRVQAAVVDFFVRLGIILAFVVVAAFAGEEAVIVGVVFGVAVSLAYAPIAMSRMEGQTLGHRSAGTRIVRFNGEPVVGGAAVTREVLVKWLVFDVIGGTFVLPTLLNYLWPLWDDKNEALHDKMCSTRVVDA
jgi:uncharacterized RDD family membrane protein YckC